MARFRPADAPASKRDRLPMKLKDDSAAKNDEFGEDPWTVADGCDTGRESTVKSSATVTATANQDEVEEEDDIALPTPIAATVPLGKIVTADGRELPYYHEIPGFVYQPLPGFEHCFKARELKQGAPSTHRSPKSSQVPPRAQETQQPASQQYAVHNQNDNESSQARATSPRKYSTVLGRPAASNLPRRKTLKRSRSVARNIRQYSPTQVASEDEDDDRDVRVTTEQSYSFYIGDFDELRKFFRRRFEELTTRPLRTIVTAWIKQLEPRRIGGYGPYHKQLPSEQPPEFTPPWWPQDVPYNEPSHLSKGNLQSLAVDFMLQHRMIDEVKRKGSWVAKLRQAAQFAVEMTTSEMFSSSKRTEFSEKMKDRALNFILPSLFDIAQSYEDHLAQYDLYEGAGNTDPGEGRHVTWQPASRPPRQIPQRKRARIPRARPALQVDCNDDASADETEVDDTISNSFLRRDQAQARKHAHASSQESNNVAAPRQVPTTPKHAAGADAPTTTVVKQDLPLSSSGLTPNLSFNQSLNDLHLGEGMGMSMDVKGGDVTQYHDQAMLRNMYSLSQPMQYSSSHPGYINQVFQPQETASSFSNSAQSSFAAANAPGFASPFSMFNASYSPQVGNTAFGASLASGNTGFPYEYGGVFPPATMLGNSDGSFNGLPTDYKFNVADPGRRHH